MNRFRIAVHIVPRQGILDPQGKAVADALHSLGFRDVIDARIGRYVLLDVIASTADAAGTTVREMCGRLLANPVTEDFEIARVDALP